MSLIYDMRYLGNPFFARLAFALPLHDGTERKQYNGLATYEACITVLLCVLLRLLFSVNADSARLRNTESTK